MRLWWFAAVFTVSSVVTMLMAPVSSPRHACDHSALLIVSSAGYRDGEQAYSHDDVDDRTCAAAAWRHLGAVVVMAVIGGSMTWWLRRPSRRDEVSNPVDQRMVA